VHSEQALLLADQASAGQLTEEIKQGG
jgi:hypothetical protein